MYTHAEINPHESFNPSLPYASLLAPSHDSGLYYPGDAGLPLSQNGDPNLPIAIRYEQPGRIIHLKCGHCWEWKRSTAHSFENALAFNFRSHPGSEACLRAQRRHSQFQQEAQFAYRMPIRSSTMPTFGPPFIASAPQPFPHVLTHAYQSSTNATPSPVNKTYPSPALTHVNSLPGSSTVRPPSCPGVALEWPGQPFYSTYPFHLHNYDDAPGSRHRLPWCMADKISGIQYIRTHDCDPYHATAGPCSSCQKLPSMVQARYEKMQSYDVDGPINNQFLNYEQITSRTTRLRKQVKQLRLKVHLFLYH
jgi:hypothetical protein